MSTAKKKIIRVGLCYICSLHNPSIDIMMWNNMKPNLEKKYSIQEINIVYKNSNIDWIEKCVQGEIDLLVGPWELSENREHNVLFSNPTYLDIHTISYIPPLANKGIITKVIKNILLGPIIIVLILALMIGLFSKNKKVIEKHNIKDYIQNSINTISRLPFNFHDYNNITTFTLCWTSLITIITFILVTFIQSNSTSKMINNYRKNVLTQKNLKNKKIIIDPGLTWSECNDHTCNSYLNLYNVKSYSSSKYPKKRLAFYLRNRNTYSGFTVKYLDNLYFQKEYPLLSKNTPNLGYVIYFWLLNKNNTGLLIDINEEIKTLKENKTMDNICKTYIPDKNIPLCSI